MPIKINELVIQVKVYDGKQEVDNANMGDNFLLNTTEQQKMAFVKDVLHLLEDQEVR